MRATVIAIALTGLASCATYSNEDARQAAPEAKPIATSALVGEEEIRPSCEEEWPDDWAMIAGCVERQTRGFQAVRRLLEQHDIRDGDTTPEVQIFGNCSREWRNHLGLLPRPTNRPGFFGRAKLAGQGRGMRHAVAAHHRWRVGQVMSYKARNI